MSENPGNPKKIVATRSSILKKPPNDTDSSDCTDTTTKKLVRRISFSSTTSVNEFMQGADKQAFWVSSYEESDPKAVNVSDIAAAAAPKGNYEILDRDIDDEPLNAAKLRPGDSNKENVTPEMTMSSSIIRDRDIDDEPLDAAKLRPGDSNKENVTPEMTMWSSIIMASKPLASSTMLNFQIDPSAGDKVIFRTGAVKKILPENSDYLSFLMKTPENVGCGKTLDFPTNEDQMKNLTLAAFKEIPTEKIRKHQDLPPEDDQMDLMMNFQKKSCNPALDISVLPESAKNTNDVPKGKKSLLSMDMTLPHIEQRKDPKKGRKTIFTTEDDNEMNITGSSDGKSQRDIPKSMEANTDLTSQEVNETGKTSLLMQKMEMTLDEGGKGIHFGRRIIYFSKDYDTGMDLIEPLSLEEDEEIAAEASKGTPNMDTTNTPLDEKAEAFKLCSGNFDLEALDAKKNPAAVSRNIRWETFTISPQKTPEKRSQIPIVVPKQGTSKKSLLGASESSKYTETLSVISAEEQEVTLPGTIKSLPSANNSTLPEILSFPRNLSTFKDDVGNRKIQANDPKFLENFLGRDLFDKLSETKDAEKKLENAIKDLEELEKKCMPTIEKFLKYPSRCQFPRSLSFIRLLRNMVESMPSIWFIEKFFYRGLMLFKHRKITTFEIYIYFDPKQLIDMDSVDSRGILYFKRIKIRDCDWYTLKDPATKSKLWIYLHTKFRRQVPVDHNFLDKYNDSNSLRDFLEYINKICCDIFAARPHIMEIVQMKEIP
ncbi:uncharacterized protein LOC129793307 [Lutzomyia longipalpis]|uniref:uncharacterized protein LOC129793307 n=1 Tax=Lutzomyia longipalpis TaxID=7200 RepID=UPI0024842A59|nr:uncharacterized protein LOC129793307 [Lutzomyia longipalpis]